MKSIDDYQWERVDTVVKVSPSWSPSHVNTTHNWALLKSSGTKRPITTVNVPDKYGFRAMSSWSRQWCSASFPPFSFATKVRPGASAWFNPRGSSVTVSLSLVPYGGSRETLLSRIRPSGFMQVSVDNAARTKVLNRVSQKKWDLAVFTVELRETTKLATDLANAVHKGYTREVERHLKGLTPRGLAAAKQLGGLDKLAQAVRKLGSEVSKQIGKKDGDLLNRFADSWMQYTFGLKPLAYDIQDATTALNVQRGRPLYGFAKAGAEREEDFLLKTTPTNTPLVVSLRQRCKIGVHYSLLYASGTEGVSDLTTLGLDSPYSAAWELLPYSWMVDYILGVGDWLNTWTATQGVKLTQGCKSTVWRGHLEYVDVNISDSNLTWDGRKPTPLVMLQGGEFTRDLLTAFPTPAIAPSFKQSVGGFQLANSLFALRRFARHF